jgi:hypothetical protein
MKPTPVVRRAMREVEERAERRDLEYSEQVSIPIPVTLRSGVLLHHPRLLTGSRFPVHFAPDESA